MTSVTTRSAVDNAETRGFAGHPSGLATLFFTEMWERFSYYGMRAFLILYMVAPAAQGGLGFADADAASIYGTYTGAAWGAAIFGGLVADRFLGQYRTVLVGGIIIALGHFVLAFKALPFFYTGLTFVALGTGLLKPNVSTLVGSLYEPGDRRRDAASRSSTWASTSAPCSARCRRLPRPARQLAHRLFRRRHRHDRGADPVRHGQAQAAGRRRPPVRAAQAARRLRRNVAAAPRSAATRPPAPASPSPPTNGHASAPSSSSSCSRRCSGAPTNRPARLSRCLPIATRNSRSSASNSRRPGSRPCSRHASSCSRRSSPGSGCASARASHRAPRSSHSAWYSSASRSSCSCPPPRLAQSDHGIRVSPWWLITAYAITELGELCISPVGLSLVTKLAPLRILGLMMGVWFLSNSAGNKLAGYAASFFSTMPLDTLFGTVAAITIVAGVLLSFMVKPIRRMMGGVL